MAARRGNKAVAGWSARMGGLVVCAFFALGVMTGFSPTGRVVAVRVTATLSSYRDRLVDALAPARNAAAGYGDILMRWAERAGIYRHRRAGAGAPEISSADLREGAIAIVERRDGFYDLYRGGELRGPVSPDKQGDLPVVSGAALDETHGQQLIDYAAVLVRAETQLSEIISEMRVEDDGTASLFLEREQTEIVIDLDRATMEIQRAIEVRDKWHGRENLIAALDLTTPGLAVVRLHMGEGSGHPKHKSALRIASSRPSGEPVAR